MVIASLLALLVATAPSTPMPGPSVQCLGRCLGGIAIGDDANLVLARLDSRPIPGSDQHIMMDANSYPNGLMLTVYYYRGTVVAVSITSTGGYAGIRLADPYGIKLGESASHLVAVRGNPTSAIGNVERYDSNGIHWDYTVDSGTITTILLSSVAQV